MTIKREVRRVAEIRSADIGGQPGVTLHCIRPGVVDDYGSLWMADTFDDSLALRMPTLCWSHDWGEPLGPPQAFRASADGPEVDFAFSDFDAVPMARRAHAQVSDGTIEDCSVGFSDVERRDPTDAERKQYPGVKEVITKATLDEVSLVLRGAVPGAKVLAVRAQPSGTVPEDDVVELARRVNAGEVTFDDARTVVELLAGERRTPDGAIDDSLQPLDVMLRTLDAADQGTLRRGLTELEARMVGLFSNDQRAMLREALLDRFQPGPDRYIWIVDFDDEQVIFELSGFDDAGTFMLAYTYANDTVTLDPGDPVSVQAVTTYIPEADDSGAAAAAATEQRAESPPDDELERLARAAIDRSR